MLSFWEKEAFLTYDFIVVGAGITGLSTAISIKELKPNSKVLILERGLLPTGASTKNAGFACFGSVTELLADLKSMTQDELLNLVERRYRGLKTLRQRLGDTQIQYEPLGGYELLDATNESAIERIEFLNGLLKSLFKEQVYADVTNKIDDFGFSRQHASAMIFNQYEGQLHTGKMMDSLWTLAMEKGVKIITGAHVNHISHGKVEVAHQSGQTLELKADQVAVCTNAFTKKLFPEIELKPGRGIVLVTRPIENLPFEGSFHMDEGYYYFRNIDQRVIFGGGRHLDFDGETTTEFEVNQKIAAVLKEKLSSIILPNTRHEVEHWWTGIMAFGDTKAPVVKRLDAHTVVGARLGGMGVAIGSLVGEEVAQLLLN